MSTGIDFKTKSGVTRHRPKVKDVKAEVLLSVLKLQKWEKLYRGWKSVLQTARESSHAKQPD